MRARDLFRPTEVNLDYVPIWDEKEGHYVWYWRLTNAQSGSGVSAGRAENHGQAGLKARQAARQHGVRIVGVVVHKEDEGVEPPSSDPELTPEPPPPRAPVRSSAAQWLSTPSELPASP